MPSLVGADGVLPKTMMAVRGWMLRSLPHGAYDKLRILFWNGGVLKLYKLHALVAEKFGRSYSVAPPLYLSFQYGSINPERYMLHGRTAARIITDFLNDNDIDIPEGSKILDFGCGCGRVMEAFDDRWRCHGCDIKPDPIRWIARYRPQWRAVVNDFRPPLPEDFTGFRLIYAISVFTHMDELSVQAWLADFHERLMPGGALLITIIESKERSFRERFGLADVVKDDTRFYYHKPKNVTYMSTDYLRDSVAGKFDLVDVRPWEGNNQTTALLRKL